MKNFLAGKRIVEKKLIWFLIPVAVILIAAIFFAIFAGVNGSIARGINVGIDFTGGTMITVNVEDIDTKYDEHVKKISDVIVKHGGVVSYSQKTGEGGSASVVVRFGMMDNEVVNDIESDVKALYEGKAVAVKTIGAVASESLIYSALGAAALSIALILIYIAIRFRNVFTGLSSILALVHDVIIVVACTIICNIQINSSFVAAIITIIAYSINNTIVVFDRVRYNQHALETKDLPRNDIVNMSIAQTLTRSINTTVTTLFAIVLLAIIGVPSIREFALPVIFGLVAGCFSSIFLAPSLYCAMSDLNDRIKSKPRKARKVKKA